MKIYVSANEKTYQDVIYECSIKLHDLKKHHLNWPSKLGHFNNLKVVKTYTLW